MGQSNHLSRDSLNINLEEFRDYSKVLVDIDPKMSQFLVSFKSGKHLSDALSFKR